MFKNPRGLILFLFFAYIALLQTYTTIAFFTHMAPGNFFQPHFEVVVELLQIFGIAQIFGAGSLDFNTAMAVFVSCLIEVIYMVSAYDHNKWSSAIKQGNARLHPIFECGVLVATVFNVITDFLYMPVSTTLKIAFTLAFVFVSLFGGHGLNFVTSNQRA